MEFILASEIARCDAWGNVARYLEHKNASFASWLCCKSARYPRYRFGLRLALTQNPSFLFVPSSMQHCPKEIGGGNATFKASRLTFVRSMKKPLRPAPGAVLLCCLIADHPAGAGRHLYMCSIITSPKPEQLTWVAPSIRRAKS